ncbi:MGH1-like glycoside hydrolase domain-containing protein [Saccharothrix lopnurensis]|uniref:Mannosylglycerate hydrolase MGH1-like glycoside hydrolase domain-containing protein n=1 Tax=Saccharothrix lopnurensis TaxID=1670621 RepID=A0ABW1NX99_9PSEU
MPPRGTARTGPGSPGGVDVAGLRARAAATLLRNRRGSTTVPTGALYPHQWSWDSAFIAVGLAHVDPGRAFAELAALHEAQWRDGRVPQIVFNPAVPEDAYFPGPASWRPLPPHGPAPGVSTTGLVQPPVHAAAVLAVAERHPGAATDAALRHLYPRLARSHDYLFERRRVASGLVAVVHPWETGLDNSPAWDEPLRAAGAGPVEAVPGLRRDLRHAEAGHRPTDQDYARYLAVVAAYRDRGYADDDLTDLPFCVVDPLFCAVLAWSEHALAGLARRVGADPGRHVERAGELAHQVHARLFDPALGCYAALDARTGRTVPRRTVAGLVPLLLPDLPAGRRSALLATLTGPAFGLGSPGVRGVPSYDLTAPDADPRRYWRGPTWMNTNWLLWTALRDHGEADLARRLAADAVDLVAGAGFREYFHPLTGEGLGADDFSWTAALLLDVLAHGPEEPRW